jgi:gamma-glutamyl:cysteine ligase YbdK (ATP-grasp superfamily)
VSTSAVLHAFGGYGVELEYVIVDRETLAPRPLADAFLREAGSGVDCDGSLLDWSNEFFAHVVELKNERPCTSLSPLVGGFEAEIAHAQRVLATHGARLMPTGMHPWMNPREAQRWPHDPQRIYATYERIFNVQSHGFANVQSMHLNLPFANDREFARLHAAIRLVLPIVPALAASSPLQDGRLARALDQRMVVYRTNAAEFPAITGRVVPEPVHDRAEYESRILAPMYEALRERDPEGVLRHEWLNSRGAIARFDRSAIEIRVPDVQECPVADLAIAAAVTSVVRAVWEREARLPQTRNVIATETLAALLDACVREADEAPVEDASYLSLLGYPGRPCSAGELWAHLLSDVPPDAPINEPMFRDALDLILEQGPLARRIVRAVGRAPEHPRVRRVYAELCDCLDAGRMFGAAR